MLVDLENVGVAFGKPLLLCTEAEILRYFICTSMAAIFNLPLTPMAESVHISPTELLDPENVGLAFRILLLSSIGVNFY